MNQTESLVTVVIPTRNRAELLSAALESVLSSPLITSPDQVIVVDDDSSDATGEVVAAAGVRYLRVKLGGPAPVRNAGLALVETPYVAFLDDDDCWLPGNMAPQLRALRENRTAGFAFGRFQMTDPHLVPFGPPYPDSPLPTGRILNFLHLRDIQLGTVLFRTAAVRSVAGFEESMRYAEDQDMLMRLTVKYPAVGVDVTGSLFRQRDWTSSEWEYIVSGIRAKKQRKVRNKNLGLEASLGTRLKAGWFHRGRDAFLLCEAANAAMSESRRRDARQLVLEALKASVVHTTLRNKAFWTTSARLLHSR